jgi:O-antigen/teichoic acid export membrane protein
MPTTSASLPVAGSWTLAAAAGVAVGAGDGSVADPLCEPGIWEVTVGGVVPWLPLPSGAGVGDAVCGTWSPKGSWYWSSPAPWASAEAGTAASNTAASRGMRRRERTMGAKSRRTSGYLACAMPVTELDPLDAATVSPGGPSPAPPGSDTAKAVGLAAATMGANLVAVAFTVLFTRLLGTDGYGSLAALLNLTVILFVGGSALQVATAREGALGRLGSGPELSATLTRWGGRLTAALAATAVLSVLARGPLAALLDVRQEWAAALVPPTAALWLLLCVQRGLLQATRAYRSVGLSIVLEALGRLAMGLALVGLGLGVTGAYAGTAASLAITALALGVLLRRRLGPPDPASPRHPLRALARGAAVPIGALTLVAALQNADVILAKHALSEDAAGIYAAATVAGKAVVWIAVGLGFYVLPEAARRAAAGDDPRPVLGRALALIGAISAVALTAFALVPGLLLRIAFGADFEGGDVILLPLGAAFALLAATTLCVQYQLGLHRRGFLWVLLAAAVAEALLLLGVDTIEAFASTVLAVQAAAALALLALSLLSPRRAR